MQTTIRSVLEEEIECRRKRIDHLLELEENGAAARESAVLEGLMIALTIIYNSAIYKKGSETCYTKFYYI